VSCEFEREFHEKGLLFLPLTKVINAHLHVLKFFRYIANFKDTMLILCAHFLRKTKNVFKSVLKLHRFLVLHVVKFSYVACAYLLA
jgi:hypothetical protein